MENSSPSATLQGSATRLGVPDGFPLGRTLVTAGAVLLAAIIGNTIPAIPFAFAHVGDRAALLHPPIGVLIAAQVGMDVAAIIVLLSLLQWAARSSFRSLGFRAPSAGAIGAGIIGAIAMFVLVNGLGSIIDTALRTHHQQLPVQIFQGIRNPNVRVQFALYAVLLGPVAEELAFRVFLFNAFMRSADFWVPAISSSVLFATVHLDLFAFLPLVLGGIILSAVYYRTANAWAPMITHALFNAGSLIAIFLAPQLAK